MKADFTHRLSKLNDKTAFDHNDLVTTIVVMAERAEGVLEMIASQFYDCDNIRMTDGTNLSALNSVINEISDIKAVMMAFNNA